MITLREKMIAFWAQNADVALTRAELCRKFNARYETVRSALETLAADGLVESSSANAEGRSSRRTVVRPAADFLDRLDDA